MCQCKTYAAIKAREDEKRREKILSDELKRTAQQNSRNGNINVLKDTYFDLLKQGKETNTWRQIQYNSLLKEQLRKPNP
jgi:hypothetical protein